MQRDLITARFWPWLEPFVFEPFEPFVLEPFVFSLEGLEIGPLVEGDVREAVSRGQVQEPLVQGSA